jgi:large subunit ribosomal protein L29
MARDSLADLTPDELAARLREAKEELFKLRFQHATGQLSNYRRMGQLRRDVARLLTRARELEIAAAEAEEAR